MEHYFNWEFVVFLILNENYKIDIKRPKNIYWNIIIIYLRNKMNVKANLN